MVECHRVTIKNEMRIFPGEDFSQLRLFISDEHVPLDIKVCLLELDVNNLYFVEFLMLDGQL